MEATLVHNNAPPIVEALRPVRRPPKIKLMMMVEVPRGWVRSTKWTPLLRVDVEGVGEIPLNGRMTWMMMPVNIVM